MSAKIYLEGGGEGEGSKELHTRCREGFRKLLEKFVPAGKMPRLVACGGRNATFDDFKTAHSNAAKGDYIAMLVDSEDPVVDLKKPWKHLKNRDGWDMPNGANDDQVLLMATCMETWIAADRPALKKHYGGKLNEGALPPLANIEQRNRKVVHDALCKATQGCTNAYEKGKRSFVVLGELTPTELRKHLRGFERVRVALLKRL